MPRADHPELLVDFRAADDGAVYRLDDGQALVQTVDFFTPIVDDPRDFGAISAANSLSDVYAMGARPITALALVCCPYRDLPEGLLGEIIAGGAEKIIESGAAVVGGHSVVDPEIKFGYAVTGLVDPRRAWRNNTPEPGDALLLTKPLGTGLIATAVKQDKLDAGTLDEPTHEMKRLNRAACEAARGFDIHAATDVTGFGLLGHLYEMIRGRSLGAVLHAGALPLFPAVWEAVAKGAITGAAKTNMDYLSSFPLAETPDFERFKPILFDPQTSGGLLLALPRNQAELLGEQLNRDGHRTAVIGRVQEEAELRVLA